MKTHLALILACLTSYSAFAGDASDFNSSPGPEKPDKTKLSYALGMNLGLQLKRANADVDPAVIAQALNDVLSGKPTQLQEADIRPIFIQAQAYEVARKTAENKSQGDAFLAKNAKEPGVTVLPDGVQYRVIKEGTGAIPQATNLLVLSFRGTYVDGKEFAHKDKFEIPLVACPKGWQEVLKLMKVGSKVEIFVPSSVAFINDRNAVAGYGSTLVYEVNILSDQPDQTAEPFGGGRLGHSPDEPFLPPRNRQ